ncbi:MAG: DUF58 domain-containing protein [Planktomarina sp.]
MTLPNLSDAQTLAAPFPPLLAEAQQLAATVAFGDHGRGRPGTGDAFWQYRPAQAGDSQRQIDWRRSARADEAFVREAEVEIAQTVLFWCDPSASMGFASNGQSKAYRAQLLTFAAAHLLLRGGERVGATGGGLRTRAGMGQLDRLHAFLAESQGADYGQPDTSDMIPQSRAVFVSDFLGPLDPVEQALAQASARGVTGAMVMILDPQELTFPFKGRSIFESMGGSIRYETQQAGDLKADYQKAIETRIKTLHDYARTAGWGFNLHTTNTSAQSGLMWLYQTLQGVR